MNDDPTAPPRKALDAATAHSPAAQWLLVDAAARLTLPCWPVEELHR